jgi:hypothetical protein
MQTKQGEKEPPADHTQPEVSLRKGIGLFVNYRNSLAKGSGWDREAMVRLVMVAYNAGPGTVATALKFARAAGDARTWFDEEHFQRALFHTGAYFVVPGKCMRGLDATTRAALHKSLNEERKALRNRAQQRNFTLAQAQAEASPRLICAVKFKRDNLPGYLDKVVKYMRFYDQNPAAKNALAGQGCPPRKSRR